MKKLNYTLSLTFFLCLLAAACFAEGTKNDLILTPAYYNNNNQIQYIMVRAKSKIDGKFQLVSGITVHCYIASESPENVLGKIVTNEKGEAVLLIPPSAKKQWNNAAKQSFIVVSEPTPLYDATKATTEITKAKLKIDTLSDKKIAVSFLELKDSIWTPLKGIDVKIAVKRLQGDLNVADAPTYATDSLGIATADFKRDSLPGDAKGNLILIARVEDNDIYGNLTAEKIAPWGTTVHYVSEFDKRTLFGRRGRSPIWLELIAYTIVAVVWGILFYLFGQIRKLKGLGLIAMSTDESL